MASKWPSLAWRIYEGRKRITGQGWRWRRRREGRLLGLQLRFSLYHLQRQWESSSTFLGGRMSITLLSCQDKVSCPRTGDSNPGQHMNLGLLNPENQVLFHNRQVHRYDWMSTQKQATKQLLVFFLKQHHNTRPLYFHVSLCFEEPGIKQ